MQVCDYKAPILSNSPIYHGVRGIDIYKQQRQEQHSKNNKCRYSDMQLWLTSNSQEGWILCEVPSDREKALNI